MSTLVAMKERGLDNQEAFTMFHTEASACAVHDCGPLVHPLGIFGQQSVDKGR